MNYISQCLRPTFHTEIFVYTADFEFEYLANYKGLFKSISMFKLMALRNCLIYKTIIKKSTVLCLFSYYV